MITPTPGYVLIEPLEKETTSENQKVLDTLNTLSPLLSAEIVKRMTTTQLFELIGVTEPSTNGVDR